jgi:hypothetical protein
MMSEWVVRKLASELKPGDRFVFDEDLGGEGDVVTVESATDVWGTIEVQTEELKDTVDIDMNTFVTMDTEE